MMVLGFARLRSAALAFALAWTTLGAAPDPSPLLPASALRADLAVLRAAFEQLHPGLYRYNTEAQIDAAFRETDATFADARSLAQAYLSLSLLVAKVRCGHTYPNFSNQTDAIAAALFRGQNRLPFYFRWLDRHMIVTTSFAQDAHLRPGTEIVSIDGTPAADVLARLLPVARADGSNDAKRIDNLQVTGAGTYEAFDVYYPLFFPPSGTAFRLQVRDPFSGAVSDVSVRALTYEERVAPVKAALAAVHGGDAPLFTFSVTANGTGTLRMPTWQTYDSKWDWKAFVDETFQQLAARHVRALVVDLRGNEGGTTAVGDAVLSHLIGTAVPRSRDRRLVRYRTVPPELRPYLETYDRSFDDWGTAAVPFDDRFYELHANEDGAGSETLEPSAPHFAGKTYVIVDAANSSATYFFAAAVRAHHLATLLGEPTGGNQRGIDGGAFYFLRLPNSHLEVDLPLIGTFPDGARPDAGLQPDVLVTPSARDIATGTDAAMRRIDDLLGTLFGRPRNARLATLSVFQLIARKDSETCHPFTRQPARIARCI